MKRFLIINLLAILLGVMPVFTEETGDLSSVNSNINSQKSQNTASNSEHKAVYIKDIEIEGINLVKPEDIANIMQLRRGDSFDRDIIQTDLKNIYRTGFFSERMKAVPIENNDGSVTLKIVLEENTPITDFTIDGNSVISDDEIMTFLEPLVGKPQNIENINSSIEKIQEYYSSKGYILARIDSFYDDPDGTVNIHLNEGEIDRILISGNQKTKDYIVARNILTEAGSIYNENQIREDLVRLYATQAFKDVKREIEPSERDPEKYDVTIMVEEQRSASVSVGAGLDTSTGVFGSAGISDNNFRGLNQRVGLNFMVGSGVVMSDSSVLNRMNLQAELNFFEPYFINADNSLMGKIFFRDFGSYQIPLAIEQRFGADVTVAHKVKSNSHLTSTFTLGLENVRLKEGGESEINSLFNKYNIPIAERAKQLDGGLFLTFSPGLTYDTRDTLINPRHGVIANVRFDEAINVKSTDTSYGKLTGYIKRYVPIGKKSSLSFLARAGGKTWGEMPEVMAFRLGGPYSIRGYKMSGVGTGNAFAMGSAELAVPVPFLDRLKINFTDNIRLTAFVDAGKIFGPTITDRIYDRPLQAIVAGVGIKVYVPGLGPLSVDYGIPLTNPGENGSKGYFTFGIGDMMY